MITGILNSLSVNAVSKDMTVDSSHPTANTDLKFV